MARFIFSSYEWSLDFCVHTNWISITLLFTHTNKLFISNVDYTDKSNLRNNRMLARINCSIATCISFEKAC